MSDRFVWGLAIAALLTAPPYAPAYAQVQTPDCTNGKCNVSSDKTQQQTVSGTQGNAIQLTNAYQINVTASSQTQRGASAEAYGSNAGQGSGAATFVGMAPGSVSLIGGMTYSGPALTTIYAATRGSNGADGKPGQAGGSGGTATATLTGTAVNLGYGGAPVTGLYAVLAQSEGGNGGAATDKNQGAGNGGTAGPVVISLSGTTVTLASTGASPGAAVAAVQLGGTGGLANTSGTAGRGGDTGAASITVTDSTIKTSGDNVAGIVLQQNGVSLTQPGLVASQKGYVGGAGGNGDTPNARDHSNGDDGGSTGGAVVTFGSVVTGTVVSTGGSGAPGVLAVATGGPGGYGAVTGGGLQSNVGGGNGGNGGDAGTGASTVSVSVVSKGALSVTTMGASSPGIQATAQGGIGAVGGNVTDFAGGGPGVGGAGGRGGPVLVDLGAGATIKTTGASSSAILAQALGGNGGKSGDESSASAATGVPGGRGGDTGVVTVNLAGGVSLNTTGQYSDGVTAQSFSGNGASAGGITGGAGDANGGRGGDGGTAGGIGLTSAASIATAGATARGILAQATSGVGGSGGSANASGKATAGSPGQGGAVGLVTVTNSGAIATAGAGSQGILAQSVSGGGGTGGAAGNALFGANGGAATGTNSPGGTIMVTNTGAITTKGESAQAIVAQSIGGGGGDGGTGNGVFSSSGGSGAAGGAGGAVTVNAGSYLTTSGALAHGVVAQSIGGGGGTGGNSQGGGAIVSYAIGGAGGTGGNGQSVTIGTAVINLQLTTSGSGAIGLLAQSIGGGGGAGGAAYAIAAGPFLSIASSTGGSGGNGGNGGTVQVTAANDNVVTGANPSAATPPVDAIGIAAQSIGGGGGVGGGASALAVAVAVPLPKDIPSVTLPIAYAVGGSGGNGGTGGGVTVNLNDGVNVVTAGAGSTGVLAQSIGGGGGQGGDSSALAASIGLGGKRLDLEDGPKTESENVALALGGRCVKGQTCTGGAGNSTVVTLGTATPSAAASRVATTGDYANGLTVQSIGGGGGNAGVGSSRAFTIGASSTKNIAMTLGSDGGAGGAGQAVTVTIDLNGSVATKGSGAAGVLAQSIGGGGGVGSGGNISLVGFTEKKSKIGDLGGSLNVALGATGGSGGAGGTVTLTNKGSIRTVANDAPGVVAQSIGGGGGVGGSAGTDETQSGDSTQSPDPAAVTSAAILATVAPEIEKPSFDFALNVNLGGAGGTASNGGAVTIDQRGSITTSGDYSPGIYAQSIGGGGGRGGAAVAGGEGNSLASVLGKYYISSNVSLGVSGNGGPAGDGGTVRVSLNGGAITTGLAGQGSAGNGFQSYGVLAQSVGGGGGTGADGTTSPNGLLFLGAGLAGKGGASGDGGGVTLDQSVAAVSNTIRTAGDAAHAVVLQSVGGGGGIGGAGSSVGVGISLLSNTFGVSLGSGPGSGGSGGAVGVNSPSLAITTTGNGAFGLLAQSVGDGGGLASVGSAPTTVKQLGATGTGSGAGGTVSVTLPDTSSIATSGVGSHGIVAQSVGGGGGIVSTYAAGQTPVLTTTLAGAPGLQPATGNGSGGAVTIISQGAITTTGAGAYGILAQSIGAGGGLATSGATVYAGTNGATAGHGSGGPVKVTLQGDINATGQNAVGIFAQSASPSGQGDQPVKVTLGYFQPALVMGGSGTQGAGIWIDGGNGNNTINVGQGSTVGALSNQAINYTGASHVDLTNDGAITGSITLNGGTTAGYGTLTNNGTLNPGTSQSVIAGNLVQSGNGRIVTTADFAARTAGSFLVTGGATLAGTVVPTLTTILPNIRLPVLTVTGAATGQLMVASTALFDFAIQPTATAAGQRFDLVTTGARFADGRFGLTAGRVAVASGLQSVFDAGATPAFGAFFAALDTVATTAPGEYARRLAQLGPRSALTVGSRRAADAASIANASMSCPVFSGATSFLTEGPCTYAKFAGRTSNEGGDGDRGNMRLDSTTWQIGGQIELTPGWFLGGSLAYEHNWLDGQDGVKGTGSSGQGAITLKHQAGPWLLTGAVFGTAGGFDLQRLVDIPGISAVAKGSPAMQSAGIRARAAYTVGIDALYLRPYVNVDGIYAHSGAYTEYGAGAFGLAFDGASQMTAVITPALEIGGRFNLGDTTVLRSFVSLGMGIRTNDTWKGSARFVGAPSGAASFSTSVQQDRTAGKLTAGVQLFSGQRIDLRAQYDSEYSGRTTTHGGALTFAYRL